MTDNTFRRERNTQHKTLKSALNSITGDMMTRKTESMLREATQALVDGSNVIVYGHSQAFAEDYLKRFAIRILVQSGMQPTGRDRQTIEYDGHRMRFMSVKVVDVPGAIDGQTDRQFFDHFSPNLY